MPPSIERVIQRASPRTLLLHTLASLSNTRASPPSPRHALLAPVTWHQEEEEDIFEDMMAVVHGDGSEEEEGEAGVPHGPHAPLPVDPLALGPAPLLPQPHGNVVPAPAVPEDSPGW